MILIIGQHARRGARPQIAQVVPIDIREARSGQISQQDHVRNRMRCRGLTDEARPCHRNRLLCEQSRKLHHGRRELNPPIASSCNVLQERGIRIQFAAQTDHAHGNADFFQSLEQANIFARLFRIGCVREEHDMPSSLVGGLHHLRSLH